MRAQKRTLEEKIGEDDRNSNISIDRDNNDESKTIEINWRAPAAEFWEHRWISRLEIGFGAGFFFSVFGVVTDGWSGNTFIFGNDYIRKPL